MNWMSFFERYGFAARFVENVPHHLGQFDDGAFRVFGIYVDQGVDIVERIHEEMGVDLVSQIIHFRLQVLTFGAPPFAVRRAGSDTAV